MLLFEMLNSIQLDEVNGIFGELLVSFINYSTHIFKKNFFWKGTRMIKFIKYWVLNSRVFYSHIIGKVLRK